MFCLKGLHVILLLFLYMCLMQSEEQGKRHRESQSTRLADLELLLNVLAAKTEVCKADLTAVH